MPKVPGPSARPSSVPHLRNIQGTGRDPHAPARTGVNPTTASGAALLAFRETEAPSRALVFPGQGAQAVGMGKDVYDEFPVARDLFDRADEILGFKLSKLCFEGPEDELQQTRNAQPAIAVTSLAYLVAAIDATPELLERPAFVAGHSLGEYSALVASGSLSFDEAVRLLRTRGELMQAAGEANPGTMAAILGLEISDCEDVCREAGAEVCNINAPGQIVIGGRRDAVVRALDYAKARGAAKVIPLSVSGAFHSSLMRPAADGMVQPVATSAIRDSGIPIVANCTAVAIEDETAIRHELVDQICRPVQWSNTVDYLSEHGVDSFIEFGPGRVLTAIIKRMYRRANCINVNSVDSVRVDLG